MNDVNEAFDAYWKTHFEKLVLPINFKKEMKKIAGTPIRKVSATMSGSTCQKIPRQQKSQ